MTSRSRKQKPPPLSLRLPPEDRRLFEQRAAESNLALTTYIRMAARSFALSDLRFVSGVKPESERAFAARMLAQLGSLGIAASITELARLARLGALSVTPEVNDALQKACGDIREIRNRLFEALGVKP